MRISQIFLHQNYSFPDPKWLPNGIHPWNDIAILKLETPVFYSDTVRPICLRDIRDAIESGEVECVSAGWGCLSELKHCDERESYPLVPYQVVLEPTKLSCKFPDRMLCAGIKGKDGPSYVS